MPKIIRSNGSDRNVPRASRSGFESSITLEPEWVMEARKMDPNFNTMVANGTLNEDGSTVDKALNPKPDPSPK